jgi:hypothetical protein
VLSTPAKAKPLASNCSLRIILPSCLQQTDADKTPDQLSRGFQDQLALGSDDAQQVSGPHQEHKLSCVLLSCAVVSMKFVSVLSMMTILIYAVSCAVSSLKFISILSMMTNHHQVCP